MNILKRILILLSLAPVLFTKLAYADLERANGVIGLIPIEKLAGVKICDRYKQKEIPLYTAARSKEQTGVLPQFHCHYICS